jgi:hypothetical protein
MNTIFLRVLRGLLLFRLLLPAGSINEPLNRILQMNDIEVYKQSEGFATEFAIGDDESEFRVWLLIFLRGLWFYERIPSGAFQSLAETCPA